MKGRRKGKDQSDGKKCVLQFPEFTPQDVNKDCPTFSAVLKREEKIRLDEVEKIQNDLESMLIAVTKRKYLLEDELQALVSAQDRKKSNEKVEIESPGKRSYPSEGKTNKRFKDNSGKAHSSPSNPRSKTKNNQASRYQDFERNDSPVDLPKIKNDSPNRFWAFTEPYFAEIAQDDIKMIQDWIMPEEDSSKEIPLLGKHFAHKWCQEDIGEEIKEGSKSVDQRKGISDSSSSNSIDGLQFLKKAEKDYDSDDCAFGPLTQRLLSCLINENFITDDTIGDTSKDIAEVTIAPSSEKSNYVKSLNRGKAAKLEKRIQKELVEIGILESKDLESENDEDELTSELKKLQNALDSVVKYNNDKKRTLLKLAKAEMSRQEIRKKLKTVDAKVMEVQRKLAAFRKEVEQPSKERDQALKTLRDQAKSSLKERENLIKQLKNLNDPC